MRVISASRRTDILAFYTPWLMERIREKYCHFMNPYSGRVHRVSLAPEDVIAFGFLTRNPGPFLPFVDGLWNQGYRFYFHISITGYPRILEEANPPLADAVDTFRRTADSISPGLAQWRYDPILISNLTPAQYHLDRFDRISGSLKGYTGRCYVSFAQFYDKTRRNLDKLNSQGLNVTDPDTEEKIRLIEGLSRIAESRGISLYSCCYPEILAAKGIKEGRCMDPDIIEALRPDLTLRLKPGPGRDTCNCIESTDIGAFHTCIHGCQYCYATNSRETALERMAAHNPKDSILFRPPSLVGADLSKVGRDLGKPRSSADSKGQMKLFGD